MGNDSIDPLRDAWYDVKFENEFLRAKGNAFQAVFERLMSAAYRADFLACRPWGNEGDRKNDGFLKSERRLFQVYAPNEMEAAKAITKITQDFDGALVHWRAHFDNWVFVHNAIEGLPPHVHKLLLDFEQANPGVRLEPWGLDELRDVFRRLSVEDKASWFGFAPTAETKATLGFGDLQIVLERLTTLPPPPMAGVRAVPMGKIEANSLSESVARLLKEGMVKSSLISEFFSKWHDESLGERLAVTFQSEYLRLRELHLPNRVFAELQTWAGGDRRGTPEHELAVLTVIAYYFERCDIFEEPQSLNP